METLTGPPDTPYRLVRRQGGAPRSTVLVGGTAIGPGSVAMIAGPCAVEDLAQTLESAQAVRRAGACILRGGAFKPRTSPYAFQGIGQAGLEILAEARARTGLPVVTEVLDVADVPMVAAYADMLQIGTRNMYNAPLLRAVGAAGRPVLLKRAMSATVQEWLLAAEYIADAGNPDIVLCERGIRTFETATRNTLDLSAVAVAQRLSHLPVIVDPSHAAGHGYLIPPLTLAAVAAGADGVIVDVHPVPEHALVDGAQALRPEQFHALMTGVRDLVRSSGRVLAATSDGTWGERPAPEVELADRRGDLQAIDERLIALAAERADIARRIGAIKAAAGIDTRDPEREQQVLAAAESASKRYGLPPSVGNDLVQLLIADAIQAQAGVHSRRTRGPGRVLAHPVSTTGGE
jgi:3-deoxy-7-phosphoheptulonate synthase